MFLGAATEGTAPNVVPQLLDQLWVLLLDLLGKLLSPDKREDRQLAHLLDLRSDFVTNLNKATSGEEFLRINLFSFK